MSSSGPLPLLSSDKVIRVLKKAGFVYAPRRGKGSHTALYKVNHTNKKRLVIVPRKKVIPRGTLLSILEQAGLSRETFLKLI